MREADHAAALAADLALIGEAAREAGAIAMRHFRQNPEVWMKIGDSPVSAADIEVDAFLRRSLLAARPRYGWLSEETLDTPERFDAARTFVVDPIDGTRAFVDGRSTWCISVAVVENGRPLAGVLECPSKHETFTARAGKGAWMNGTRLAVRARPADPVIAGPKALFDSLPDAVVRRATRHSYVPSLAYRIALVAKGDIDATFVRPGANDWDLAAAELVLVEAGGAVRAPGGAAPRYGGPDTRHGTLAAGSGALLEILSHAIDGHAGHAPPVSKST